MLTEDKIFETKNTDFFDFLVLMVKWKKFLLLITASVFVVSYLFIYFFIQEEFEAKSVIIPSDNQQISGLSSLMKNLGNLPLGLKGNSASAEIDMYTTILNSRSTLEDIIRKFDLQKDYDPESMEKTVKAFKKSIKTEVTDENAYEITVNAYSPEKAVDISNYILELINKREIALNVAKSKNNRMFLEERYNEMKENLRLAEDSMSVYQQETGMFEAKEQTKLIINAYSIIESELTAKQIELSIVEKTFSENSSQVQNLRTTVVEFQKKLNEMKTGENGENVILALNTLPLKAKAYLRHYRNVEIYSKILEFLVPMYEQARFEEQKNVPVLQIVDAPVKPEKKSYPPRVLFSLLIAFGSLIISFFYVLYQENEELQKSKKLNYIFDNISRWK
ncbi:MAG: hypothetical protein FJ218_02160 [Ignavibacteria bacterium]|nr:hypothetical protein [Ignavibacteria bacterium]